jgi:hypothetical protein
VEEEEALVEEEQESKRLRTIFPTSTRKSPI